MRKVSLRIVPFVLEPQEVITRDNVTVRVDAVVYFMVIDPVKAVINVEDYGQAIIQLALTTLRSVLGQSELDELLAHRDQINLRLREIIDEQSEEPWGVRATLVEVKDVLLPEAMQRAMAKQAEAEREKRGKIIPVGKPTFVTYEQRIRDGWYINTLSKGAWVVRKNSDEFVVFDPRCTHLNCPYYWGWTSHGSAEENGVDLFF